MTDRRPVGGTAALLRLQQTAGNRAALAAIGRRPPPESLPQVQREMKFEIQTPNQVFRNDGTATALERKYGPQDFLVKGTSGVRLESETRGALEFETGWSKKWSKLRDQLTEAVSMARKMTPAAGAIGRIPFPFDVGQLRAGSPGELKRGFWKRRKGMEGSKEKILGRTETLEVEVGDPTWNSGFQTSESILLSQYESLLTQHEWPAYRDPLVASADGIVDSVRPKGGKPLALENLRNFVMMIVNYIKRGQGGEASDKAGAFKDVAGKPSKQAFTLLSRTDFSSIYRTLLNRTERRLFRRILKRRIILTEMGMNRRTPFFVAGFGSHGHHAGPTVAAWLAGIPRGVDRLSVQSDPALSSAQGRHDVNTKRGKKDTRLVKFEVRNTVLGAFKPASDWIDYAHDRFIEAATLRTRKTGKKETGLEL